MFFALVRSFLLDYDFEEGEGGAADGDVGGFGAVEGRGEDATEGVGVEGMWVSGEEVADGFLEVCLFES